MSHTGAFTARARRVAGALLPILTTILVASLAGQAQAQSIEIPESNPNFPALWEMRDDALLARQAQAPTTITQTAGGATWTLTGDAYVAQGTTYTYTLTLTSGNKPTNEYAGFHLPNTSDNQDKLGTDPNDCTSPEQFCISFKGGITQGGTLNNVQGHDTRYTLLSVTSPHTLTATFAVAADAPLGSTIEFGAIKQNGLPREDGMIITVGDAPGVTVSKKSGGQSYNNSGRQATITVSISADKTTAVFKEDGITYTLTRSGATTDALPVSVTLTQTKDFLLAADLTETVTIAAGQSTKTFTVAASSFEHFAAGTLVEAGTLTATVQDGTDYDLGTPSSVDVAIVIGATVRFEMASYSVGEADFFLNVYLIARTGPGAPKPTSNTSSLFFRAVDGSAAGGIDYHFSNVAQQFFPSQFSMSDGVWQAEELFGITIANDGLDEDDETFDLNLEYDVGHQNTPLVDASGNSCGTKCTVTATITDNDNDTAGVTVSKTMVTVTEQDTTGDSYTVVLDSQPTADVVVTVVGHSGTDVTPTPTTLTFTSTTWNTPQPVTVTAADDADTVNDTVSLTHSAASTDANYNGITIGGVAVSVHDNDTGNNLATGKPAISGTAQVGETLTAAIGNIADTDGLPTTFPDDYTFKWLRVDADGVSNETAIGDDAATYTPVAADVGKKVRVQVSFTDDESNREERISDAYPSSGTITAATLPALSISDIIVNENAGPAILTVNLTPASTGTVTVDYATRDSFAKAGEDYTATSGTLTFTAGQTSKTITVPITDDDVYENGLKVFFVDLSNPTGATLPDPPLAAVRIDSEEAAPTASMADVTVDEGAGTMTLTLRLSHPSQRDIAYLTIYDEDYDTGTATKGDDYDDFLLGPGRTAKITVPARSLSQTFDITLVDDGVDEPDETIVIEWIKNLNDDATPDFITFTGTITDNDAAGNNPATGTLAISGTAQVGETLTAAIGNIADTDGLPTTFPDDYTFKWLRVDADGVSNETAIGDDAATYTPVAADVGKKVRVQVSFTDDESNREERISDAYPSSGTITDIDGNNPATGTLAISGTAQVGETLTAAIGNIADTDGLPTTFPDDYTFKWLRVDADGVSNETAIGDDAATYTPVAADVGKKVRVQVSFTDDESNREERTSDAYPSSGTITAATLPALSFEDANITVGETAGTATLTVELDPASTGTVTVDFATRDGVGGAKAGEDYTATSDTLTFAATETSKTITVPILNDDVYENNESFFVDLSNPTGATVPVHLTATVTIDSEDAAPTVRFGASSYTAIEGVAGAVVTVLLDTAAARAVTIPVTTTPQGGASSTDYSDVPGSVTFAAGETEQSFTVTATKDSADDDGESVQLGFDTLPSGVLLGSPATATVALVDNADVSTWFLFFEESSYTATEGGTAAQVTVGLNNPWKPELNESLTIGIFTPEHRGGADAADYSGVPARVTFQPGQTRVSFPVTAIDDSDDDDGESIYLQFAGFNIEDLELDRGPRATTVHLRDNDGASAVQAFFGAQTYRVDEGGSAVDVSVHLDKAPGRELTILITTAHGNGASSADYSGVPESITFSGSQSTRTFAVQAQNENVNDDQEYLTFGFGALPASVSAGDPATTTLNLVDTGDALNVRTISFDGQDTNVRELLEGSIYSLYVYLNSAADNDIVVPLQVVKHLGGATTADYSGLPETVIIPAGERRENVIIRVLEDTEDDHGEGIRVGFGSLPRGVRKDDQADTATFRFLDNDTLPAISIAGTDVKEWPNPQSYLKFVASLDYAPEFEVTVDYRTVDGTAVAGQDYESKSGTLTFAEGKRSKYIRVRVCHDGIDESTETMTLQLSNPVRTKLEGNGSATGSIRNNNGSGAKPCATGISVSDVSYPEPNINHLRGQEMEFEVSLNQADTGMVTVDYQTVNGTATAGEDYESASGTVTFRPGQTRRTVKVVVIADAHDDPGETFTLRLSNPSGAYIGDGEGTATLTNSGLMPAAWLSRFGRVASDHAVQAIEARIYDTTSGRARENHLTIAGQRVGWQMLGRFAPPGPGQRGDRASPDGVAPRLDPWLGDQAARTRMDRLGAEAMAVRSPAVGSLSVGGMADLDSGGSPAIDSLSGEGMAGVDSGHARGSGGGDAKGTFRRAVMELLGLEDFSRLSEAGVGLMGSSFFYSRPGGDEAPGWLGPWSLWGETAVTRFDGAEGPLSLNGDVTHRHGRVRHPQGTLDGGVGAGV